MIACREGRLRMAYGRQAYGFIVVSCRYKLSSIQSAAKSMPIWRLSTWACSAPPSSVVKILIVLFFEPTASKSFWAFSTGTNVVRAVGDEKRAGDILRHVLQREFFCNGDAFFRRLCPNHPAELKNPIAPPWSGSWRFSA